MSTNFLIDRAKREAEETRGEPPDNFWGNMLRTLRACPNREAELPDGLDLVVNSLIVYAGGGATEAVPPWMTSVICRYDEGTRKMWDSVHTFLTAGRQAGLSSAYLLDRLRHRAEESTDHYLTKQLRLER